MSYILIMMAATAVAMLKSIILPRLLAIDDYGIYATYYQIVSISIPMITLGYIEYYMLRFGRSRSFSETRVQKTFWESYFTTILFSLLFGAICAVFSYLLLFNDRYIVSVLIFFSSVLQVAFFWFLRGERAKGNLDFFAFMMIIRIATDVALLIIFEVSSVYEVIYVESLSFILSLIYIFLKSDNGKVTIGFIPINRMLKRLRVSIPYGYTAVISALTLFVDKLFVSYHFDNDIVGYYNMVFLISLPVYASYNILYQYWLPKINLNSLKEKKLLNLVKNDSNIIIPLSVFSILFLVVTPFLSKYFFLNIYNVDVDYSILFIASLSMFFYLNNYFEMYLLARGHANKVSHNYMIALVVEICALILAVFLDLGLIYFSLCFLCSRIIISTVNFRTLLKFSRNIK